MPPSLHDCPCIVGDGSSGRRDLPESERSSEMRTHSLTQREQVPVTGQGSQAVPVGVPRATASPLERDLTVRVGGGLAQQGPFFGCHSLFLLGWPASTSGPDWLPGLQRAWAARTYNSPAGRDGVRQLGLRCPRPWTAAPTSSPQLRCGPGGRTWRETRGAPAGLMDG